MQNTLFIASRSNKLVTVTQRLTNKRRTVIDIIRLRNISSINSSSIGSLSLRQTNDSPNTSYNRNCRMITRWNSNNNMSFLATAALAYTIPTTVMNHSFVRAFDVSSFTVNVPHHHHQRLLNHGPNQWSGPFLSQPVPSRYFSTHNLFSSVSDGDTTTTDEDTTVVGTTTDTDGGKVIAQGTAITFVPSSNGHSGVMAVKLKEEDIKIVVKDDGDDVDDVDVVAAVEMAKKHRAGAQGDDFMGKTVEFNDGRKGMIVAQRPPMAFVLCDFPEFDTENAEEEINVLSTRSSVSVGEHLKGSVVDYKGEPISSSSSSTSTTQATEGESMERAILAPIPRVSDIALIDTPLLTGTAMVDALAPIGKGQNMLVIGQDFGVGQREFVIAMIRAQIDEYTASTLESKKMVKFVYALTSDDMEVKNEVLKMLEEADVMEHVVVVTTRGVDATTEKGEVNAADAGEAVAIAGTACSIGEAFAQSPDRYDSLVIIDDIDSHKELWDWSTRVLVDVYGADAVVKEEMEGGASSEMRAFYSSIIQRAARYKAVDGGGSMTLLLLTNLPGKFGSQTTDNSESDDEVFSLEDFAESSEKIRARLSILTKSSIPLTATNLRKIDIPIPTSSNSERIRRMALVHVDELISMSDGQIWFDETLHAAGRRPAVDAQRSITRVGIGADTKSRADAPAMRRLAGGLRFKFAQAEGSSLDGAGVGSGVDRQVLSRDAYRLAMHQETTTGVRSLSENSVLLLAAGMGCLNEVVERGDGPGTEGGRMVMEEILEKVWEVEGDGMREIDATLDISTSVREALEAVIKGHFE